MQVQWHFLGRQLSPRGGTAMRDEGGNNHSLVMTSVTPARFGNYTCKAANSVGDAETVVSLSGLPFAAAVTSKAKGRYRNEYTLTWTVKSYASIKETSIAYKSCVSAVAFFSDYYLIYSLSWLDPL